MDVPMAAVALPTLPKATISSPPRRLIAAAMRRPSQYYRSTYSFYCSHPASIQKKTFVSFAPFVPSVSTLK
jgi:hypothetical protein